jgi:hypothetical protein
MTDLLQTLKTFKDNFSGFFGSAVVAQFYVLLNEFGCKIMPLTLQV